MARSRSDADRPAEGADGYSFEDFLTDLLGLPPLTADERRALAAEGLAEAPAHAA